MNGKEVHVGVSLLVGNMDNMVRFYRDILGFKRNGMVVRLLTLKRQVVNYPCLCIAGKNLPRQ